MCEIQTNKTTQLKKIMSVFYVGRKTLCGWYTEILMGR